MSMFPHTVTVYNTVTEEDDRLNTTTVNYITILHGVLLSASKAINVRETGNEGADAVTLYIPFTVEAVDGESGEAKTYVKPIEFNALDDKNGYWTLSLTGNGGATFFAKGEVVEPDLTFSGILLKHDDVYTVTKVDTKDYGGKMQHFQVGGA